MKWNVEGQAGARTILVVTDFAQGEWRWISAYFPGHRWRFAELPAPGGFGRLRRLPAALRVMAANRDADLLVSHQPGVTRLMELARRLLAPHARHVGYSFNFTALPRGRRLWGAALKGVESIVVSARSEVGLYAEAFGLSPAQVDFVPWGVAAPTPAAAREVAGDYVCAIGGNMRDYRTLVEVARAMPGTRFLFVVRPHNLAGFDLPANVEVRVNLPLDRTMALLRDAQAMVLPLLGEDVPCGHVTLVAAAWLGVPVVATRSEGIADYVEDGVTGLTAPPGDAPAMAAALRRLLDDPALAARIGAAARAEAERDWTEANYLAHFGAFLDGSGHKKA